MTNQMVEGKIKSFTKEIENLRMQQVKQETIIENAKNQRKKVLDELETLGYTNIEELPMIIENLEKDIQNYMHEIETLLYS